MTIHTSSFTRPVLLALGTFLLFGLPIRGLEISSDARVLDFSMLTSHYAASIKGSDARYFEQTGKMVSGDFLRTFDKDGLAQIGYPISDEMTDGDLTVQYFERSRMEYHPEMAGTDAAVQLSRLGAQFASPDGFPQVPSFAAAPGNAYIPETGHSLATPFLEYWSNHGGVEMFGYPISEAITQDGLYVQWFERARMEYHPELKGTEWEVQLTQLGSIAYGNATGVASAQAAPSGGDNTGILDQESKLLALVNSKRAEAGVMPLTAITPLVQVAHGRSSDMAQRNYFSHVSPEGRTFLDILHEQNIGFGFAGETIAYNNAAPDQAVQLAMDTFMNSPSHRAILLDPQFDYAGVGFVAGGNGQNYFTVIVIRK
jgi:uncharacterized protein YkwD